MRGWRCRQSLITDYYFTSNHNRKDVRLPVALQRAMAAEAEAAREARAKVITAEGEEKVGRMNNKPDYSLAL